ncbi:DNA-binding protein [Photobacterium phosphoreum]|nr:DNA-binding protein [Photobacterium phosphoreum]
MNTQSLIIVSPYQTVDLFSVNSGLSVDMVHKMVASGRLPILPKASPKQKTLINVALLTSTAINAKH